ncbi:hypothetical protein SAMN04488548_1342589 [Gordonia westfalica]|uniref:Uncharacterized protein n=1 Tax=Gordonia westfalica TaxID=158898 RepID=A0A1H2JWV2_9ACTN|nr:hypothetical protein SAMN04488548_1342589 [Gordonia westfalica]
MVAAVGVLDVVSEIASHGVGVAGPRSGGVGTRAGVEYQHPALAAQVCRRRCSAAARRRFPAAQRDTPSGCSRVPTPSPSPRRPRSARRVPAGPRSKSRATSIGSRDLGRCRRSRLKSRATSFRQAPERVDAGPPAWRGDAEHPPCHPGTTGETSVSVPRHRRHFCRSRPDVVDRRQRSGVRNARHGTWADVHRVRSSMGADGARFGSTAPVIYTEVSD